MVEVIIKEFQKNQKYILEQEIVAIPLERKKELVISSKKIKQLNIIRGEKENEFFKIKRFSKQIIRIYGKI